MEAGLYTHPQVHVRRKSSFGPQEEDRAFSHAVEAAAGTPRLCPVVWAGKHLGWVRGVGPFSPYVYWTRNTDPGLNEMGLDTHKWWAGFNGIDGIINAVTGSTVAKFMQAWGKAHTGSPGGGSGLNWHDLWPIRGDPEIGAYGGTALTSKQYSDTTAGSIAHGGNVSSATKHLTRIWTMSQSGTPTLLLYDRVLGYDACPFNANSNTPFTTTLTAQRYLGTGLPGMLICGECDALTGATASNLTALAYTDDEGNTSQAMPTSRTIIIGTGSATPTNALGARIDMPVAASGTNNWGPFLPLAAGDSGVRLIANWTTSAANTGTHCMALLYPMGFAPTYAAGVVAMHDTVLQIMKLTRIYDGACLSFLTYFHASTASRLSGGVDFMWA